MYDTFFISVTSQALEPPSSCHKLSHFLRPPPPSSVTYFMDGPYRCESIPGKAGYQSMGAVLSTDWIGERRTLRRANKAAGRKRGIFMNFIDKADSRPRDPVKTPYCILYRLETRRIEQLRSIWRGIPKTCARTTAASWERGLYTNTHLAELVITASRDQIDMLRRLSSWSSTCHARFTNRGL